jgi:hypothetical protein
LSGPRPATFQHYKPERRKIAKENRKKIGKQLPRSRLSNIVKRREKKKKNRLGSYEHKGSQKGSQDGIQVIATTTLDHS